MMNVQILYLWSFAVFGFHSFISSSFLSRLAGSQASKLFVFGVVAFFVFIWE
jgi:hypothetical protein